MPVMCHLSLSPPFQALTLHRYGHGLPIVRGDSGGCHGDHSLPRWDGADDTVLARLGDRGQCCAGGCDAGLALHRVDKQPAAKPAGRRGAVPVHQRGGGGGDTCSRRWGGVIFNSPLQDGWTDVWWDTNRRSVNRHSPFMVLLELSSGPWLMGV